MFINSHDSLTIKNIKLSAIKRNLWRTLLQAIMHSNIWCHDQQACAQINFIKNSKAYVTKLHLGVSTALGYAIYKAYICVLQMAASKTLLAFVALFSLLCWISWLPTLNW